MYVGSGYLFSPAMADTAAAIRQALQKPDAENRHVL
jgi:hypothetical protein